MTGAGDRRNMLVLAAHTAALAAGLWFAWAQWTGVGDGEASLRQARVMTDELDRRLREPGAGLPAGGRGRDPLLEGSTAALAGAGLQDRVVSAIRAAGGTVTSSQVEAGPSGEEGARSGPAPLALTVSFDLGNAPLQALLYGLEGGTPPLFLDRLSITLPDDGRSGVLRVSMTVSGYWRGENRS